MNYECVEEKDDTKFYLIFWVGADASRQIGFNDEAKCDEVLKDIIAGNGIVISLTDFPDAPKRYYPNKVLKLKVFK